MAEEYYFLAFFHVERKPQHRKSEVQREENGNNAEGRIQEAKDCWREIEILGKRGSWSQRDLQNWNRLFKKVISLLKQPALQENNSTAQYLLRRYWNSYGVPPDYRKNGKPEIETEVWLKMAAANGHPEAQWECGIRLESLAIDDGRQPLDEAYELAAELFRRASKQDHPHAMLHLGLLTESGLCRSADEDDASKLYENAAKNLGPRAYLIVANWYDELDDRSHGGNRRVGRVVRNCTQLAIRWYTKAAELGEHSAYLYLANIYRHGPDLFKDLLKAESCYRIVSKMGDAEIKKVARQRLGELRQSPMFWIQKSTCFFRALFHGSSNKYDSPKPRCIVKAPMPGRILRLSVKNGTRISEGDEVLVIESMKMEIPIKASKTGNISFSVNQDDNIRTGDLLFTIV